MNSSCPPRTRQFLPLVLVLVYSFSLLCWFESELHRFTALNIRLVYYVYRIYYSRCLIEFCVAN